MLTLEKICSCKPVPDSGGLFAGDSYGEMPQGRFSFALPFWRYVKGEIYGAVKDNCTNFSEGSLSKISGIYCKYFFTLFSGIADKLVTEELSYEQWRALFDKYPVAERLAYGWTEDFIKYITGFIKTAEKSYGRFSEAGISAGCGKIHKLRPSGSDIHDGTTVLFVEFESGEKLVYKSSAADTDHLFEAVINKLADLSNTAPFYFPKHLQTENGTFHEFISCDPVSSEEGFRLFFRRSGFLLAGVYFLNGSDIHAENIIAHGDCPVIVDTETITSDLIYENEFDDVTVSKMLPFLTADKTFSACPDALTCRCADSQNLPFDWQGTRTAYQYRDEVISGFTAAYETLLNNLEAFLSDGNIRKYISADFRILLRNTNEYYRTITLLTRRKYLESKQKYESILSRYDEAEYYCLSRSGEDGNDYIKQEKAAMRRTYIPKIMTRGAPEKRAEKLERRTRSFSAENMRKQTGIITALLTDVKISDGRDEFTLPDITVLTETGGLRDNIKIIADRAFTAYRTGEKFKRSKIFKTDFNSLRYYLSADLEYLPDGSLGLLPAMYKYSELFSDSELKAIADNISDSVKEHFDLVRPEGFGYGLTQGGDGIIVMCNILCGLGITEPFDCMRKKLAAFYSKKRPKRSAVYSGTYCSLYYGIAASLAAFSGLPPKLRGEVRDTENYIAAQVLNSIKEQENKPGGAPDGRLISLLLAKDGLSEEVRRQAEDIFSAAMKERGGSRICCGNLFPLYYSRSADSGIAYSRNHNLTFGNSAVLSALEECAMFREARILASAVADDMAKKILSGQPALGEHGSYSFPSFYSGYGGVLFGLLRALESE